MNIKQRFNLKEMSKPDQLLLADPISAQTHLIRRNLLFFSVVVLVLIAYGDNAIKLPVANLPKGVLAGAVACVVIYHLVSFLISYTTDVQSWHVANRVVIGEENLASLKHLSEKLSEIEADFNMLEGHLLSHEKVYKEEINSVTKPLLTYISDNKGTDNATIIERKINECINRLKHFCNPPSDCEISKVCQGKPFREVIRFTEVARHFVDAEQGYRRQLKLITRETLQVRVVQYSKIYLWEGLLPVVIAVFTLHRSYESALHFLSKLI